MKFQNKWNKGIYTVVEKSESGITLQREDSSRFTIAYSEFKFNYVSIN